MQSYGYRCPSARHNRRPLLSVGPRTDDELVTNRERTSAVYGHPSLAPTLQVKDIETLLGDDRETCPLTITRSAR